MTQHARWETFAVVALAVVCTAQAPADTAARVQAGLDALAAGRGDWKAFSVTYDDVHGLHGGLRLTIAGDGRVEQTAVRTKVRGTRQVAPSDLQRLVTMLRDLRAWEQRTPERAPVPDESRSRLIIRTAGGETTIWEWYNDMPKNARIVRVRDLMTDVAWMPR